MERDSPIGTRVRLTNGVRHDFLGKMATIVPHADLRISWPNDITTHHNYVIRMDDICGYHLYWGTKAHSMEFIEGPELPMRCYANKRELAAHVDRRNETARAVT